MVPQSITYRKNVTGLINFHKTFGPVKITVITDVHSCLFLFLIFLLIFISLFSCPSFSFHACLSIFTCLSLSLFIHLALSSHVYLWFLVRVVVCCVGLCVVCWCVVVCWAVRVVVVCAFLLVFHWKTLPCERSIRSRVYIQNVPVPLTLSSTLSLARCQRRPWRRTHHVMTELIISLDSRLQLAWTNTVRGVQSPNGYVWGWAWMYAMQVWPTTRTFSDGGDGRNRGPDHEGRVTGGPHIRVPCKQRLRRPRLDQEQQGEDSSARELCSRHREYITRGGHSWTTRRLSIMLDGSCTTQVSEWEERQETQSRRTSDRPLMMRSKCWATTTVDAFKETLPGPTRSQLQNNMRRSPRSAGRFS